MATVFYTVDVRLRRGIFYFLVAVNAFRYAAGRSFWIPDWAIVTEVKAHAA